MKRALILLVMSIITSQITAEDNKQSGWGIVGTPVGFAHPCKGSDDIYAQFEGGLPPEEENQYNMHIPFKLPSQSNIEMEFDSEAVAKLLNPSVARISTSNNQFNIKFFNESNGMGIKIKGTRIGQVPYLKSLIINTVEYCKEPNIGFLDKVISGYQDTAVVSLTVPDDSCGRRKVEHTELITNGLETKPGDFPWHTAIYKLDRSNIKYICGGTLISKTLVLTAAHCATIRGVPLLPEILSVVLGKYNLIGGDISAQEREVHQIIVHEKYNFTRLDNDITLLKLKTEASFSDYVQPACIWNNNAYEKLPQKQVFGTVVGWGFDQSDALSTQLRQAIMPKVTENTCLKSNPVFFSRMLTDSKFCAGFRNGTSACNGDSGGGFLVFVPDKAKDNFENATGAWYVRGVVSVGVARRNVAICDPNEFVLFTDIAKYKSWINNHLKI